jgi:hypothetical protein
MILIVFYVIDTDKGLMAETLSVDCSRHLAPQELTRRNDQGIELGCGVSDGFQYLLLPLRNLYRS